MGKAFATELAHVDRTLEWAADQDVQSLVRFLQVAGRYPLVAVGSGGSLSAAYLAALLHRDAYRQVSVPTTPLEVLLGQSGIAAACPLILSASGRNRDVVECAKSCIAAEVPALAALSTVTGGRLCRELKAFPRSYVLETDVPGGRDGFLATNSLVATMALLLRAYGHQPLTHLPNASIDSTVLAGRDSLLVLHGGWSTPAAMDLESKFSESAVASVHVSDYRNFGHGRHLWLHRRRDESAVVALVSPQTARLAERTLRCLPKEAAVLIIETQHDGPVGSLDLTLQGFRLVEELAGAQGVDPGRPRVPDFGRRLFHLPPAVPKERVRRLWPAPVERKLGIEGAGMPGMARAYRLAMVQFVKRISGADIGAIVLDYDGTLCETASRYDPLPEAIINEVARIIDLGVRVGIATGRGKSARDAFRRQLTETKWASVTMGYYNGSDIAELQSVDAPEPGPVDPHLIRLNKVLKRDPFIATTASIEPRASQTSVTPLAECDFGTIASRLDCLAASIAPPRLDVLRSAHSVDVLAPGTTKKAVVDVVRESVSPRDVVCIGDQGDWPGNDFYLLSEPLSLSVDSVSPLLQTCWNLAPPGERGPVVTLRYLKAFKSDGVGVHFDVEELMRDS